MSLFGKSSEEKECDKNVEMQHGHEGPFERLDDTWEARFDPLKHDDKWVYGYVETENYGICENCGEKVKLTSRYVRQEFHKIRKEEIPEADLEQVEVALGRLPWR